MRGVKPKRPCRKAQAAKDPLHTPRHTKPLVFLPCLVWGCQRERRSSRARPFEGGGRDAGARSGGERVGLDCPLSFSLSLHPLKRLEHALEVLLLVRG